MLDSLSDRSPPAPAYWAKVNYYESGAVEVTATCIPPNHRPRVDGLIRITVGQPDKVPRVRTEETERQDKARAVGRARATVRRSCMTFGADRLLTCTFRRNETSSARAWAQWARFVRLVHKKYPQWLYVVVAERQQRGAVHFHAAVKGFQPVRFLRECWLRACDDGNIDVTAPRRGLSAVERSGGVSRYLVKYISKAFADSPKGEHRYRLSGAIEVPCVRFWLDSESYPDAREEALAFATGQGVRPLRQLFFGDDWSCIWAVAWPDS